MLKLEIREKNDDGYQHIFSGKFTFLLFILNSILSMKKCMMLDYTRNC